MKQSEHYKKVLQITGILIAIVYIVWLLFSPISSEGMSSSIVNAHYRRFSTIFLCIGTFWLIYYNTLWKWKSNLFRQIFFDQPNLNGTWMGYLKSDYKNNGEPIPPLEIVLFIRQNNFFDIRITSQTLKYAGFSFGETLDYNSTNKTIRLLYQYSQKKTIPDSSDDRQGAADLNLYDDYLAGHYWTIVKTAGFIRVNKLSDKTFNSFEEASRNVGDLTKMKECYDIVAGLDISNVL